MRRGLTVVEVLVASAIVIVFLAVGYPAARAIIGRSHGSACAEKLHTLGNSLVLYANDHDGALPPATTAEVAFKDLPGLPEGALEASPDELRTMMLPYVASPEAWFCPTDPHKGENVVWLGQRHNVTNFLYAPKPGTEAPLWPPKLELGKGSDPLLSDAFGLEGKKPASNHPDGSVNLLAHDLSLTRRKAKDLVKN